MKVEFREVRVVTLPGGGWSKTVYFGGDLDGCLHESSSGETLVASHLKYAEAYANAGVARVVYVNADTSSKMFGQTLVWEGDTVTSFSLGEHRIYDWEPDELNVPLTRKEAAAKVRIRTGAPMEACMDACAFTLNVVEDAVDYINRQGQA